MTDAQPGDGLRARRVVPDDADLLRTLMLHASADQALEHAHFRAQARSHWTELALRGSTARDTAIFLLVDDASPTGAGVLWCHLRRSGVAANLGWWWLHPGVEATPAEPALYGEADRWATQHGARHLVSATDDPREAAALRRSGFSYSGLAADGIRTVYTRPCGL